MRRERESDSDWRLQETLNFWKQLTHVLKYFRAEEEPKAKLPKNFIQGFIEVSRGKKYLACMKSSTDGSIGTELRKLHIQNRSSSTVVHIIPLERLLHYTFPISLSRAQPCRGPLAKAA